jgi:transketolase
MAFDREKLTEEEIGRLGEFSRQAKGDILKMTKIAGSGHPGGSMSSLDIYLVVFSYADLAADVRDRIVVSHGHTSPGVYSALARLGHLPVDEVVAFFRKTGSPYEGHVVRGIPFIDWSTGNLGQGLSAGCGLALRASMSKEDFHVYVMMSDGEQAKGQVAEARRFANKFGLANITAVVDYNKIQIGGNVNKVMPVHIVEDYLADGWDVIEIDGHSHGEIYSALRRARNAGKPTCIVANTIIGKGVPFMEGKEEYHGRALNDSEYVKAMEALALDDDLPIFREKRKTTWEWRPSLEDRSVAIDVGQAFTYSDKDGLDNRSAFGKALKDLGAKNIPVGRPVAVFDCDLASSVKTSDFAAAYPDWFFEGGVQEHNTATISGVLSTMGVLTFFADFGAFGIDETYNQHRLNDINRANLKLVLTHLGLDVGQDGKTHQCVDYAALARNLHNMRAIIPADVNQTDRVVRFAAGEKGNFLIGMGRSKWPVVCREDGKPFFADDYSFVYGKMEVVRRGKDAAIISYGGMLSKALTIRDRLSESGLDVGVINMPSVNEIDQETVASLSGLPLICTYEDHNVDTGIGPQIAYSLLNKGYRGRMMSFGVKRYGFSGDTEELFKAEGLDVDSMVETLLDVMK